MRNLEEMARQRSCFTEDDWEAYRSAVVVEASKNIRQEQSTTYAKQSDWVGMTILFLDDELTQRLDAVKQRMGTSSLDATLSVLLDGYEWLHRGGSIPHFLPKPFVATVSEDSYPLPYAIRQETSARLEAVDQVKAARGLEYVIERVLDTYEWLLQGGLSKKLFACVAPGPEDAWIQVEPQLKVCLEEIAEEEGDGLDETLVTLIWSYDWFYRSGLFEQVKELASTALSFFDLDDRDQERIERAMKREKPEDRFRYIQELYLDDARHVLKEEE